MNGIDIESAVKAPFRDEKWAEKTLLGLVWYILFVTSPALLGAQVQYIRGVAAGDETLPDWGEFGIQWLKGVVIILAVIIYSIPLILLAGIMFVPAIVAAVAGEGGAAGAFAIGAGLLYAGIAFVYSVALSILLLAAFTNYAVHGRFTALLDIGDIWRRIRGEGSYWTAWLFSIGISIAASIVSAALGATVIGIILIPAVAYLQIMMTAHLLGQWAAKAYPPLEPVVVQPKPSQPMPPQPTAPQQTVSQATQPEPTPSRPATPEDAAMPHEPADSSTDQPEPGEASRSEDSSQSGQSAQPAESSDSAESPSGGDPSDGTVDDRP